MHTFPGECAAYFCVKYILAHSRCTIADVHAVHSLVGLRARDVAADPVDLRLRLQRRRNDRERILRGATIAELIQTPF